MKRVGSIEENLKAFMVKVEAVSIGPTKSVLQKMLEEKVNQSELFSDQVYTLKDWARLKTWRRHLWRPRSTVQFMRGYIVLVYYCLVMSMLICSYHFWLVPRGAPGWGENGSDQMWQVFNLTSFALALLLVFRTNSSYDRRMFPMKVVGSKEGVGDNDQPDEAISWFPGEEENLLLMYARWSIAMSFALKSHLRGQSAIPELQRILPESELDWLADNPHPPSCCAQVLSDILTTLDIPQFQRITMDEDIKLYVDIMGICERIHKTPIPPTWTGHTSRFLLCYLTFLPFALWPVYGWATPGIQAVVALLLLGIENVGVQIEEPFAVLALDAFCAVCERSVQGLMANRRGSLSLVEKARFRPSSRLGSRASSMGGHCGSVTLPPLPPQNCILHSGEHLPQHKAGEHKPRGSVEIV